MAIVWNPQTNSYEDLGQSVAPTPDSPKTTLSSKFSDPAEQSMYEKRLKQLSASSSQPAIEPSSEAQVGKPAETSMGMGATQGGLQAAKTAAEGGSKADALGGGLTTAGVATSQPELVAAGLAVSALSSVQKAKQAKEQNRYAAEMQKYNQRQNAIQNLAQIGQSLKA